MLVNLIFADQEELPSAPQSPENLGDVTQTPSKSQLSSSPPQDGKLSRGDSVEQDSVKFIGRDDSLEELLRARREDPEAILLALGFGGPPNDDPLARIPVRFLSHPSQAQGVDLNEFLERCLLSRGYGPYASTPYFPFNSLEGHSIPSSKVPPARFSGPSVPLTGQSPSSPFSPEPPPLRFYLPFSLGSRPCFLI